MSQNEQIWNSNLNNILKKAEVGDENAIRAVYNHYHDTLSTQAKQLGGTDTDVQNTFIEVFRNLKQLQDKSQFETYLYSTLQNIINGASQKTQSPAVEQAVPTKEPAVKKKSKLIPVLLAVLLLIGTGTVGYYKGLPYLAESLKEKAMDQYQDEQYEKAAGTFRTTSKIAGILKDEEILGIANYGFYSSVNKLVYNVYNEEERVKSLKLAEKYMHQLNIPVMRSLYYNIYNNQYRETRYWRNWYKDGKVDSWSHSSYERDREGHILKTIYYGKDGEISSITEYQYNEDDLQTGSITFDKDGKPTEYTDITYNNDGKKLKSVTYSDSAKTKKTKWIEYHYDDTGDLLDYEDYVDYGSGPYITYKCEYLNDENGKSAGYRIYQGTKDRLYLSSETKYDDSGYHQQDTSYKWHSDEIQSVTSYSYDFFHRITELRTYEPDEEVQNKVIRYESDPYSCVTTFIRTYDTEGNLLEVTENHFNDDNLLIDSVTHDAEGNLLKVTENDYNDDGFRISSVSHDGEGNLLSESQYMVSETGLRLSYVTKDGEGNITEDGETEYMFIPFK